MCYFVRWLALLLMVFATPALSQETPAPAEPSAEVEPSSSAAAAPAGDAAPADAITVELNKLAPAENACQAYVVVTNGMSQPIEELQLDVYLFDAAGVILNGVALQFVDLRAGRPTVVPFELADLACPDIGRILLNKVLVCNGPGGTAIEGCADRIRVSARGEIPFEF